MRLHPPSFRTTLRMGCVIVPVFIISLMSFASASASPLNAGSGAIIIVNSTTDMASPTDSQCSLREAIMASNTSTASGSATGECAAGVAGQTDTIIFSISGSGVRTITVGTTDLPAITQPVVIDGTTQPGATCGTWPPALKIEVRGPGWTGWPTTTSPNTPPNLRTGLTVSAAGTIIRGLIITKWDNGISLVSSDNIVACNYIGVDSTGAAAVPNNVGILDNSGATNNKIGGTTTTDRNLISGNANGGLWINGTGTSVQGNYVGTDATGTTAIGNGGTNHASNVYSAIAIGGSNDTIGGSTAEAGNVVSGNNGGVEIDNATAATIQGNLIGLNAAGTAALPNWLGMNILSRGGHNVTENVISGNALMGIAMSYIISGTSDVRITGNKIGTDAGGTNPVPNGSDSSIGGGIGLHNASGAQVNGNLIAHHTYPGDFGLNVDGTTLGSSQNNCLLGNTTSLLNSTATAVTFTNNYWGMASGPIVGTDITGTGQAQVTYSPFLTTPPAACPLAMSLSSASHSFGSQLVSTLSSPFTFTLTNFGTTDMHPGALSSGTSDFSISSNTCTGATIPPYGSCTFAVTFTPSVAGARWGSMSIPSDALGSPATVNLAGSGVMSGSGATITVNTTSDTVNATDGLCSLREAITAANTNATSGFVPGECAAGDSTSADTIAFAIGSGAQTIQPTSALPSVTGAVVIDGTTQPGYAGTPIIQLDGSQVGMFISGLTVNAPGGATIRGLVINRFDGNGIQLLSSNNKVVGSYLGAGLDGTTAPGNGQSGIYISNANNNIIGGSTAGDGNLISGNGTHQVSPNQGEGIFISTGSGNVIQGNRIGTDLAGIAALGNQYGGILVNPGTNTIIGGSNPGEGNIISGNANPGIVGIFSTGTVIKGNKIGTNVAGTASLGNNQAGIVLWYGSSTVVGGTIPAERNIISGNTGHGLYIGGVMPAGSTVITIQGNYIGADASGAPVLGNTQDGIQMTGQVRGTIGGTSAGAGNLIAGNGGAGISVPDPTSYGTQSTAVAFLQNSIYGNGALGINLSNDAVTVNDTGDADQGANFLQNYPVLTSALANPSTITVAGTFNSTANTIFRLEFFASPSCDASGYGEGQTYLGTASIRTNSSGNASFSAALAASVPVGQSVTATATHSTGNYTSEFSACRTVTAGPPAEPMTPTTYGFGPQLVNTSSSPFTFIVVNTGVSDLHIGTLSQGGSSAFILSNDACSGATIAPIGTCTFDVTFSPTAAGGVWGTISIPSDAAGAPYTVNLAGTGVTSGAGATITVTTSSDTTSATDGLCSLREAITAANMDEASGFIPGECPAGNWTNTDTITFAIGGGAQTIQPHSELPAITGKVVIDGTTQPGFAGTPIIELDGSMAGSGASGLTINAPGYSTIRGLVINRFDVSGLQLFSDNNTIVSNYIGVDISGNVPRGNGQYGIHLDTANGNKIGGSVAGSGNVISGNGTHITGPDQGAGICLTTSGSNNTIQGNRIGTNVAGTAALGNTGAGVSALYFGTAMPSPVTYVQIGGANPGEGNVISGNGDMGVLSYSTWYTKITGNMIGTDVSGMSALGNANGGIKLFYSMIWADIGGEEAGERNIISGNGGNGITVGGTPELPANNIIIIGNYIGADATGAPVLGNAHDGILVTGLLNAGLIGTQLGSGNIIAGNGGNGVNLPDATSPGTAAAFMPIYNNSIYNNAELGINLGDAGPTPNDLNDPDEGANLQQNYPVLTSAQTGNGTITVTGVVNSTPIDSIRVEFFANPSCDPSGYGEGQTYLGYTYGDTGSSRSFSFSKTLTADVPVGSAITATATNMHGYLGSGYYTSEFSACLTATERPAVSLVPPSNPFGNVLVGRSSSVATFTLANNDTSDLHVSSFSQNGSNAFTVSGNSCTDGTTVTPGNSCTFGVTFSPITIGEVSGGVTIVSDGPGSPHTVSFDGTGMQPIVSLAPATNPFGNVWLGQSSSPVTFTLTNVGNASLYVSSVTRTGSSAFTLSNNSCAGKPTLVPNASCTFDVTFSPTAIGYVSGGVNIADDAPGSPQNVSFDGTGVQQPIASLLPASHDFGTLAQGVVSSPFAFTLSNDGGSDLTIDSISTSGDFMVSGGDCGSMLAASASCSIEVTFSPTETGIRTGMLSVSSDGPTSPVTADLSGTGLNMLAPPVLRSPKDGGLVHKPQVKLVWKGIKGSQGYHVQLGLGTDLDQLQEADPTKANATFTLPEFGTYFWQVATRDSLGLSVYQTPFQFEYTLNASPKNGVTLKNGWVRFIWKAIKGSTYTLEVYQLSSDDPPVKTTVLTPPPQTRTSYTMSKKEAPLSSGTYYWRVSINGGTTWTNPWMFKVP